MNQYVRKERSHTHTFTQLCKQVTFNNAFECFWHCEYECDDRSLIIQDTKNALVYLKCYTWSKDYIHLFSSCLSSSVQYNNFVTQVIDEGRSNDALNQDTILWLHVRNNHRICKIDTEYRYCQVSWMSWSDGVE